MLHGRRSRRHSLIELAQTYCRINSAIVGRLFQQVKIHGSLVHEDLAQARHNARLQGYDDIFDLLPRYGIPAGVRFAKSAYIMVVLALNDDATQRERVFKFSCQSFGQKEVFGGFLLVFEPLYQPRGVAMRCDD